MTSQHTVRISTLVFITVLSLVAISSIAEARDSRDRGDDRTDENVVAPVPAPSPAPIHIPNTSSGGGISSDTNADVDTGGNTGGTVTTGDESATESEVNVGPTNPSPPPPPPSDDGEFEEVPENPCDSRTRTNCDAESPPRER